MKISATHSVDICIVGGGVAGLAAAIRLVNLGYDVVVIDDACPRTRFGESLSSSAIDLLLDLDPSLFERLPVRPIFYTEKKWGYLDSRYVNTDYGRPRWVMVDRRNLDECLGKQFVGLGGKFLKPARCGSPIRKGLFNWMVPVQFCGTEMSLAARFIVQATGNHALLPGSRSRISASTMAIYGYWPNKDELTEHMVVGGEATHWYWAAPLPDGTIHAIVFVDPKTLAGEPSIESVYGERVAQSDLLKPLVKTGLATNIGIANATAYRAKKPVTEDSLKIGAACVAIDPILSSGIYVSLLLAIQAATVINTIFLYSDRTGLASNFFRESVDHVVEHYREMARSSYAEGGVGFDTSFWQDRAEGKTKVHYFKKNQNINFLDSNLQLCLNDKMSLVDTPVIKGDLIEESVGVRIPGHLRPISFVGDLPVASFIQNFKPGDTIAQVLKKWSLSFSPDLASTVLNHFLSEGIVQPINKSNEPLPVLVGPTG